MKMILKALVFLMVAQSAFAEDTRVYDRANRMTSVSKIGIDSTKGYLYFVRVLKNRSDQTGSSVEKNNLEELESRLKSGMQTAADVSFLRQKLKQNPNTNGLSFSQAQEEIDVQEAIAELVRLQDSYPGDAVFNNRDQAAEDAIINIKMRMFNKKYLKAVHGAIQVDEQVLDLNFIDSVLAEGGKNQIQVQKLEVLRKHVNEGELTIAEKNYIDQMRATKSAENALRK